MGKDIRKKIEVLNAALKPYYTLLIMIGFFITAFITSYTIIVKSPELSVNVNKEEINYPNSINEKYVDVFNYVDNQETSDKIQTSAIAVYDYLLRTNENWLIRLKNETNRTLNNVNLRVINVNQITSWAVSSNFLIEEEKDRILKNLNFQENSGVVYIRDFINLPPNSSLTIHLWGNFNKSIMDNDVRVTFDEGTGIIEKSINVTGFKAYLVDYFFEIISLVLLSFCLVYIYKAKDE